MSTRVKQIRALAKKYGIRLTKRAPAKGYRKASDLRAAIVRAGGTIPAGLYSKATTTTSNRKAEACRPRRTKAGLIRKRNPDTGRCRGVKRSAPCKPGKVRGPSGRCKADKKKPKKKMVDGKERTCYYNTKNGRWYYNTRAGKNGKATKHYVSA